jgi:DNA-binding transcriptional LysR family regulator
MVPKRDGIELRHLRYFLAAAEHSSFRRAGSALGVQESAISRRIRDLEDQLGASLFQRHNGGVRLTVAGEKFKARARAIIEQVRDGVVDISLIGRGVDGRIRIGLVAPVTNGFLSELLREFIKSHEGVHIELVEGEPTEHVKALRRFDLDIAFLVETRSFCGCDSVRLWSERLHALLPREHPLSHCAELSWMALASETFLIAGTALSQDLRCLLTRRLADVGHRPIVQSQNVGCDNLLPLVALGRGILLATESMVERCGPSLVSRLISGETIAFAAVWSPHNDNPAFRRFLSMAKARRSRDIGSNGPTN